jgi:hypothetical protein
MSVPLIMAAVRRIVPILLAHTTAHAALASLSTSTRVAATVSELE